MKKLNLGPHDTRKDARVALVEAGYTETHVKKGPRKWVIPGTDKAKAVRQRLSGSGWVIVPYPEKLTTKMRFTHGDD